MRRVRLRKAMLVASPSSQPRIAEARMIQTSEAFVSPKTQLSFTLRVFARMSATRQTSRATRANATL